ncbi:MAG: hypothetical protein ABSC94_18210 [Polyangiaceae bacterium]
MAACAADGGAATLSFANQNYVGDPRARPTEAIFTGLNTSDDPYVQTMRLTNTGTSAVTVTSIGIADNASVFPVTFRQHSEPQAFEATLPADGGAALPATIAAGAYIDIQVKFLSTQANPPPRVDNLGDDAVAAWLVAETSNAGCVQAGLYGISFWNDSESISEAGVPSGNYARFEPTLGQIIATLGYQVNVGENLETYLNVNQVAGAAALAPPPIGDTPSDEVIVPYFIQADPTQPAVLLAVGRFAPKVDFPFGYYPRGAVTFATAQPAALAPLEVPDGGLFPPGLQYVATMSSVNGSDPYSSDHSEMSLPPIYGNTAGTFTTDGPFGLWCFGAQRSDGTVGYDGSVNPNVPNGDYDYSDDTLNIVNQTGNPPLPTDLSEAGTNYGLTTPVHRYRTWPLKDRAGNAVANAYLIALEEATNCDFQDMVFTLSNVKPWTPDGGTSEVVDAGADADAGTDAHGDGGGDQ